jgi:hypothetical protein
VTLRKSLRFIEIHPLWLCQLAFVSRLAASMEHPALNFHPELGGTTQKARPPRGDRALFCYLRLRA